MKRAEGSPRSWNSYEKNYCYQINVSTWPTPYLPSVTPLLHLCFSKQVVLKRKLPILIYQFQALKISGNFIPCLLLSHFRVSWWTYIIHKKRFRNPTTKLTLHLSGISGLQGSRCQTYLQQNGLETNDVTLTFILKLYSTIWCISAHLFCKNVTNLDIF